MYYRYLKLCVVNPHLFELRNLIDKNFQSELSKLQLISGSPKKVRSSITFQLAFKFDLDYHTIAILYLIQVKHQKMFKWVLEKHANNLIFLLQNGIVYKYTELQAMFSNGDFQRITGGAMQVSFLEYEYGMVKDHTP